MLTVPLTPSIGKYRLVAELGAGGMANVYLAVMLARNGFSKLVVLKVPREHVADDPELLAMFLDEARLAARLNHANVVQTYEVAEDSGRDVIVMEYLEGQTLSEVLVRGRKSERPLPLDLHLRIILETLQGLHYAHELADYNGEPLELVHRDVSPQNVFVTFDGRVKVLDFGIAKAATSSHVTKAGTIKGKVRYMPPEQFAGGDVDRRADIFAVGVVLWEAATGQKLWKGAPDNEVIANVIRGNIPPPRERNPDLDERLQKIILKALASDREHRYATCLELQADLESFLEDTGVRTTTKDVGIFISDLFAETRRERLRIIDEQVRRANAENSGEYRVLGAGDFPSGSFSQSTITPLASSLAPQTAWPVAAPNISADSSQVRAGAPLAERPGARFAAAMAAVVACIAVAFFAVKVAVTPATAPASSATAAATAPPTAVPIPAATEVTLTFSAKPKEAMIFLDEEPLGANPQKRTVLRDGSAHTVRVEAKGYVTKSAVVHFDSEKELTLSLDRAASAPVFTPPPPRPPPTHTPPPPTTQPTVSPANTPAAPSTASNVPPSDGRPRRPDRRIDDKL